ncbi:MAG TPA: hypothetical protein VGC05_01635 [Mycobacterium sp.]
MASRVSAPHISSALATAASTNRRSSALRVRFPEAVSSFEDAIVADDFDVVTVPIGEAIGLIHEGRPAADIVHEMARDAANILGRGAHSVQG